MPGMTGTHAGALLTMTISPNIKTIEIRMMPRVGKVYNMKVSGSDEYMVGQDGVVVRDY